MTERTARLERFAADERSARDLERRLAELDDLAEAALAGRAADLAALSTLGDETRYELASLLAAADGELAVCELDAVVEVSQSAISHALSDLAEAGLVTANEDGRFRYYRTTDRAERLLTALDATRADGDG